MFGVRCAMCDGVRMVAQQVMQVVQHGDTAQAMPHIICTSYAHQSSGHVLVALWLLERWAGVKCAVG